MKKGLRSMGEGNGRLVLGVVEAMVRAVVASCGREDRIIDEDRFSGILEGDSDGIVSVIVAAASVAVRDR
jgi:hypothetical protein